MADDGHTKRFKQCFQSKEGKELPSPPKLLSIPTGYSLRTRWRANTTSGVSLEYAKSR